MSDLDIVASVPELSWIEPWYAKDIAEADLTRAWGVAESEQQALADKIGSLLVRPNLTPAPVGEWSARFAADTGEALIHLKMPFEAAQERLPLRPGNQLVLSGEPQSWKLYGVAMGLGVVATAVASRDGVGIAVRPMTQAAYESIVARRQKVPPDVR